LLKRAALLTRAVRFGFEPAGEFGSIAVEFAGALPFWISRENGAGAQIASDRVSGDTQAFGDVAQ